MIILYTTHCPKCKVLETKLKQAKVEYSVVENLEEMKRLNIDSVPILRIDDEFLNYTEAVKWVNREGNLV